MAIRGRKFKKTPYGFVEDKPKGADEKAGTVVMMPKALVPTPGPGYKPVKESDGRYHFVREASGKATRGPAKFNSNQFRQNWDQVFGDGDDEGAGGMTN